MRNAAIARVLRLALCSLAVAACTSPEEPQQPPQPPPYLCDGPFSSLSCAGGAAVGSSAYGRSTSRTIACPLPDQRFTATCAQGCAIAQQGTWSAIDATALADPRVLCAETPAAKVGDPCDAQRPCLPTRAVIAADGTVSGQTYLACGAGGTCVEAAPPTIAGFLGPCTAAVVQQFGIAGATGYVELGGGGYDAGGDVCLIAWDAAAKAPASGVSHTCAGDWDCPAGALCDDRLGELNGVGQAAVCKPGPRGTLTPAMLTR